MHSEPLKMGRENNSAPSREMKQMDAGAAPRFSIIVPVYMQWRLIPALLKRLGSQGFPSDRFEVILVNNGSPEFSPLTDLPANAEVLRCEVPGSYAARNHGSLAARGDWLIFTDADCLPASDWLERIDEGIDRHGSNALIAGPVDIVSSTGKPGPWEIFDMVKGIPQERYVARGYAATANLAISRATFRALGGFDEQRFSGGDVDLCRRAGAAGYRIVYQRHARVEHPARRTWEEIATKTRRIKGGQLAAGSPGRRLVWLLRTAVPPVRAAWRFLRARHHSLRHRLVAILVLGRVWTVELAETIRLGAGGAPERR